MPVLQLGRTHVLFWVIDPLSGFGVDRAIT